MTHTQAAQMLIRNLARWGGHRRGERTQIRHSRNVQPNISRLGSLENHCLGAQQQMCKMQKPRPPLGSDRSLANNLLAQALSMSLVGAAASRRPGTQPPRDQHVVAVPSSDADADCCSSMDERWQRIAAAFPELEDLFFRPEVTAALRYAPGAVLSAVQSRLQLQPYTSCNCIKTRSMSPPESSASSAIQSAIRYASGAVTRLQSDLFGTTPFAHSRSVAVPSVSFYRCTAVCC